MKIKALIAVLFSAASLWAQATFSSFSVDVKSHSTARIGFTTSAVLTNYYNLEWDTQATPPFANATAYRSDVSSPTWYIGYFTAGNPTAVYVPYGHSCLSGYKLLVASATSGWAPLNGTRTCTNVDVNHFTVDSDTTGATTGSVGTAQYLRYEVTVAGLPADDTIYYRACDTSGANCSAVQNFDTDAEPGDPYPAPTAPTASGALSSIPTSFDRTESTVTDCANLQTAINTALGRGETGNVLLPIQKGLNCSLASNPGLSIGANTNTGYLVIRPDSADSELPPNGVRISTGWETSMVTLSAGSFGVGRFLVRLTSTDRIYLMGIILTNDFPTASTKSITGATAASPIVYTSTAHGYSNDDILQIREVGGVTGANVTNCKVQNKSDNTFECKDSSGTGSYTTGGYAVKTPPIAPSAIYGYDLTNIVVDRCIIRYVWPAMGQAGAIWLHGLEGSSGVRNTDINLINNLVYNVNDWVPVDPDTGARATCCSNAPYEGMIIIDADRVLVQNNKLDVPGISFFDDGGRITDLTYRRNLNDWNTAWKYASASTGWPVTVRQQFEMKSCFRCKLDGNQWLNQWRGGLGQSTGGYNVPILFSGCSMYDGFTGEYGFSDLTITNNLFVDAPGGINIGNAGGYQFDQKPIRNILISNNLMYGIDWSKRDATSGAADQYGFPSFLVLGGPFENLRVENNTLWDNRAFLNNWNRAISLSGGARGAYFRVHNNFWAHNHDTVYGNIYWTDTGTGVLPAPDNTPNTDSITSKFLHDVDFSGNVIVPGVVDGSATEANYSNVAYNYAQSTCATYWAGRSGVTCHGTNETTAYTRFGTVGFTDYAARNFRLLPSSDYYAAAPGVNQDTLENALGKVKSVSISGLTDTGATINYTAPDTDACTVEYGTSATWGTGDRENDGGGAVARNVALGGLSTTTAYYYRVLCAAEQPSGGFETTGQQRLHIGGSVSISGTVVIQ
jgi:hypothetical protein